ncbi:peptide deformylase [PVC group bacterium (ex Bugula neritina AB1)]|nr:peptide deformylase [PVC group bacterium (ex Bugula neritina AB1)]
MVSVRFLLKDILFYPDDVLRKVSSPVESHEFGSPMKKFIEELYSSMDKANGIGLAAPQVGVLKNVLVYKTVGEKEEVNDYLINPKITYTEGNTLVEEGCLSLPGVFAKVPRSVKITIEAQDFEGKPFTKTTECFSSIVIQHETDHLVGKLFVDKLSLMKRKMLLTKYNRNSRRN